MQSFESFFLFGLSRAGVSVAHALAKQGIDCAGVWTPNPVRKGRPNPDELGFVLKPLDSWGGRANTLLILASRDEQLPNLVESIRASAVKNAPGAGCCALHLSGCQGLDVLAPLQPLGLSTAAIHPLRAFSCHMTEGNALQDVFCGIEKGSSPQGMLIEVFQAAGAKMITIEPAHKMTYHAAAAMASNLLISLMASAESALRRACPDLTDPRAVIRSLALKSLDEYSVMGADLALTGPIERGDVATVAGHLAVLADQPNADHVYRALSLSLLPLLARSNAPGADKIGELKEILNRRS